MPPSTRTCITEIVTRVATIEAKVEATAHRIERYIDEERETHKEIHTAIASIRGLAVRVAAFVVITLIAVVAHLLINDRPWDIHP